MVRMNMKLLFVLFLSLLLVLKIDLQSHATYAWEEGTAQAALPAYKDSTLLTGPQWKPGIFESDHPTEAAEPVIEPIKEPVVEPVPVMAVPQPLSYVVNPGDTLYNISTQFSISVDSLIAENLIEEPHQLAIGQQLQIPAAEAAIPLPDGQQKLIKQVISSTLTAYTAGLESTGKTENHPAYGITFSGIRAEEGRTIAVDPSFIPLGSQVYIDGVGIRTAEDTGSGVRGARIDVYMDDLGQAVQFGVKRNVKVYLLSAENI